MDTKVSDYISTFLKHELLAANHRLLWLSAFVAELETRLGVHRTEPWLSAFGAELETRLGVHRTEP